MRNSPLCRLVPFACLLTLVAGPAAAGSLDPAGPPGSDETAMRTLNEIEPDTIISALPYTINESGSYSVISNLLGESSAPGILITANNVKLDLNGFALGGVSGSTDGIQVSASSQNIAIRNGTVRGWGGYGVSAEGAMGSLFEFLKAYGNTAGGLRLGADSLVVNCKAHDNGGDGIYVTDGSIVKQCSARNNNRHGISAENGSRVVDCTASKNCTNGINVQVYCTVEGCTTLWNKFDGIWVGARCRIVNNNGGENDEYRQNNGAGIRINGNSNRIEGNNLIENMFGILVTDPLVQDNLIVRNSASLNVTNYQWSTGRNHYGRILDSNTMGESFSNSNPWVNFDF
ncbi:MAG: right-handed parallel beta-helix repeat-containing protein [Kiritimatiellae bacterium]|nr:right-handed parallel beta-helix repeat-containing protein [Kiritimatiellia bacterium]